MTTKTPQRRAKETLAQSIVTHPSLSRLNDEQRECIRCTIIATKSDLDGLCFRAAQAMARHSKGRITYVEGCLVDLDVPPEYEWANDPARSGRFHHGWNRIDGVDIDINMILRIPDGRLEHERGEEIPIDELRGDGYSYHSDEYAYTVFGTDEEMEAEA